MAALKIPPLRRSVCQPHESGLHVMHSRSIQLLGWILFVLSAIGFIVSSARLGDVAGIAGGVLFLAGCLVFIFPLLGR